MILGGRERERLKEREKEKERDNERGKRREYLSRSTPTRVKKGSMM